MLHTDKRQSAHISIIGAGIAGTWQALLLSRAGFDVTLFERDDASLKTSTGYWAGGMLAPYCEAEATEPVVTRLGLRSLDLWDEELPAVHAAARWSSRIAATAAISTALPSARTATSWSMPSASPRWSRSSKASSTARCSTPANIMSSRARCCRDLHAKLREQGVRVRYGVDDATPADGVTIDCRGIAARDDVTDLRGVKGEMIVVETRDVALHRPVRLLHPRWPLYIVPRENNRFMIGATTIEAEDSGVSVRSALELLSAAYAVHPAFAEARIVEIGAGLRPAFPDNLPRIRIEGERISVNGLYRHGFLLAPALAELTTAYLQRGAIDNEVMQCA